MANTAAAKKVLRQDAKRAQRNKIAKAEIKSLRVKIRKMVEIKDGVKALELAKLISKKLDKAQTKNIYKKNTVARYKSRIMKKVNALGKK
jgi:small subunit ribosomal protein S20